MNDPSPPTTTTSHPGCEIMQCFTMLCETKNGFQTAYVVPTIPNRLLARRNSVMIAGNEKGKCTRRQLLVQSPVAAAVIASLQFSPALLPTSDEVTRELAELAANIPGLGQADVFYPLFFRGEWKVRERENRTSILCVLIPFHEN